MDIRIVWIKQPISVYFNNQRTPIGRFSIRCQMFMTNHSSVSLREYTKSICYKIVKIGCYDYIMFIHT